MSKLHRTNGFLGTSFLDLLSCALGGVLLLVFLLQRQSEQVIDQLERDKTELAQKLLDLKRGISVPLPLAVQIHWEGAGDIDLSVVKDGGERVWFPDEERQRPWGELMRDERQGMVISSELFFSPKLVPGRYDVYVWYFAGGNQPEYQVDGEVVLYPGEPSRSKRRQFSIVLPISPRQQWRRVATYRLTEAGGEFHIEFFD